MHEVHLVTEPNTTPLPSVAVCLQANYGIHNIARVWGKPVITPMPKIAHDPFDSLFYTYLFPLFFSSSLFERVYMHVICVDRKLRRDLHARPDQENASAGLRPQLTWCTAVPPAAHNLSSSFKSDLDSPSHSTRASFCPGNLRKNNNFWIWKSSSARFKGQEDERVGFKICQTQKGVNLNTAGYFVRCVNVHHKGCNFSFSPQSNDGKKDCLFL